LARPAKVGFYLRRADANINPMARGDCRNAGMLMSLAEAAETRACEEYPDITEAETWYFVFVMKAWRRVGPSPTLEVETLRQNFGLLVEALA
jgi:hypothetical protein